MQAWSFTKNQIKTFFTSFTAIFSLNEISFINRTLNCFVLKNSSDDTCGT